MAKDFVVNVLLNDSSFLKGLDNDVSALKEIEKVGTLASLGIAKIASLMVNTTNTSTNYKKQLKDLTKQITDLTINYRRLTDDEKNTDFGKATARKIDELTSKASEIRDAMDDINTSIKKSASDTQMWDMTSLGILVVSASMSALNAVTGLTGNSEEKLKEVIALVAKIQLVANSAIQIGNALLKQSALLVGIRTILDKAGAMALKLKTTCEIANTNATKASTVALAAFNAVAKANPYVLLATAVLGVATALYAFSSKSEDAKLKEMELLAEAANTKKKLEELKHASEVLGNKTGDLVGSFLVLLAQWKSLKKEADKKEWIKNNLSAFEKLNLSVWNINDAYEVFIRKAPLVIAALKAIAKAEAYLDLYKDAVKKKAVEWDNRQLSKATGDYYTTAKKGDRSFSVSGSIDLIPDEWKKAGISQGSGTSYEWGGGQSGAGYWILDDAGASKLNQYRQKVAKTLNQSLLKDYDATIEHYEELMDLANAEAQSSKVVLNSIGGTGSKPSNGSGKGSKVESKMPGSKAWYNEQISETLKKLDNTPIEIKGLINPDYTKVKDKLYELKSDMDRLYKEPSNEDISAPIDRAIDSASELIQKLLEGNDELKGIVELDSAGVQTDLEEMNDAYDEQVDLALELQTKLKKLEKAFFDLCDAGGEDTDMFLTLSEHIKTTREELSATVKEANRFGKAINKDTRRIKSFNKTSEDADNISGFFTEAANAVGVFGESTGALAAEFALNTAANIANCISLIAAMNAVAIANGTASAFALPFPACLAAYATIIATIASTFASLPVFSDGGIFEGATTIGDYNLARVNKGEMILNNQELKHLWNMIEDGSINHSGFNASEVVFRLKGLELVGLAKNHNKKMSKVL